MYQVILEEPAQRILRKLERALQERLLKALVKLEKNPRTTGTCQLKGMKDLFRLRVGDYRIIYQVKESELLVLVITLGHRREIYQRLKNHRVS